MLEIEPAHESEFNVLVDEDDEILEEANFDFNEAEFDPEIDGPLPLPPLALSNYQENYQVQTISTENWDEGSNAKMQAYTRLKAEKDKLFVENTVFKKFRGIFKGLKRIHKRCNQPNKLTEYEIPTDTTKYNRVMDDFDPAILFEEEYAKDDLKNNKE